MDVDVDVILAFPCPLSLMPVLFSSQALLVQELLSLRKKEEQIRELQLYLLKSWVPSFG